MRTVHELYMDAATGILRVARRFDALGYSEYARALEATLTLVESLAWCHILQIAREHARP